MISRLFCESGIDFYFFTGSPKSLLNDAKMTSIWGPAGLTIPTLGGLGVDFGIPPVNFGRGSWQLWRGSWQLSAECCKFVVRSHPLGRLRAALEALWVVFCRLWTPFGLTLVCFAIAKRHRKFSRVSPFRIMTFVGSFGLEPQLQL